VERIFEDRIQQQIKVDDMQFGFMKGKGTNDAIFTVRQMQENFRVKGKKLYFGFVDLDKALERVPTEVIRWAVRKLEVEEWLVSAVMSRFTGATRWLYCVECPQYSTRQRSASNIHRSGMLRKNR